MIGITETGVLLDIPVIMPLSWGLRCVVKDCPSRSSHGDVIMHRFPKDPAVAEVWKARCEVVGKTCNRVVCSRHFLPSDYASSQRLRIKRLPSQCLSKTYTSSIFPSPKTFSIISKSVKINQYITHRGASSFEVSKSQQLVAPVIPPKPSDATPPLAQCSKVLSTLPIPDNNSDTSTLMDVSTTSNLTAPLRVSKTSPIIINPRPMPTVDLAPQVVKALNIPPESVKKLNIPPQSVKTLNIPPENVKKVVIPLEGVKKLNLPPQSVKILNKTRESVQALNVPPKSVKKLILSQEGIKTLKKPPESAQAINVPENSQTFDVPQSLKTLNIPPQSVKTSNIPQNRLTFATTQSFKKVNAPQTVKTLNTASLRVNRLSPREENDALIIACRTLESRVRTLTAENQKKPSQKEMLKFLKPKLTKTAFQMVRMQLSSSSAAERGKPLLPKKLRALCVNLHKLSPKLYENMSAVLNLPNKSAVIKTMHDIPFDVGVSEPLRELLKEKSASMHREDRFCAVAFCEMSIDPNLEYCDDRDQIVGYVDYGDKDAAPSQLVACHALVFMALGLRTKWMLPVAFYYSHKTTSSETFQRLILEVISFLFEVDFPVVATICNGDPTYVATINRLVAPSEPPKFGTRPTYFTVTIFGKFHKIFTIYDAQHLLKGTRNLLIKYDVSFNSTVRAEKSCVASWSHIKDFYEDDKNPAYMKLRLAQKLTFDHIYPSRVAKLRLKLASQVFSYTVSAGIYARVETKLFPTCFNNTAEFIYHINCLFDSLSAGASARRCPKQLYKKYKTCIRDESKHDALYKELLPWIDTWDFVDAHHVPFTKSGWIVTIQAICGLWEMMRDNYNYKFLAPARLNQAPLEFFFSNIRRHGSSNSKLTALQFVAGLKTAMIKTVSVPKPRSSNSDENSHPLLFHLETFMELTPKKTKQGANIAEAPEQQEIENSEWIVDPWIINEAPDEDPTLQWHLTNPESSFYVASFLVKRVLYKTDFCTLCENELTCKSGSLEGNAFTYRKKGLLHGSKKMIDFVQQVHESFLNGQPDEILDQCFSGPNIVKNRVNELKEQIDFSWLTCPSEHRKLVINGVLVLLVKMLLKAWCKSYNQAMLSMESTKIKSTKDCQT